MGVKKRFFMERKGEEKEGEEEDEAEGEHAVLGVWPGESTSGFLRQAPSGPQWTGEEDSAEVSKCSAVGRDSECDHRFSSEES